MGSKPSSPDFLIIGAQKCGTTALRHSLSQHPEVFIASCPGPDSEEFHFFNHGEVWDRGVEWYQSFFDQPDKLQGEKSPHYFDNADAHPRMAEVVPDAKLILMLRNPVQRAYSAWNHYNQQPSVTAKWGWQVQSFEQALDSNAASATNLVRDGYYLLHLHRLLAWFPREQVHIVVTERLRDDPQREYERVQTFLGLSQRHPWQGDQHVRKYAEPMQPRDYKRLQAHFAAYNRALFGFLGEELSEWGEQAPVPDALPAEPTFDIVITCMGRLEHLKQSLPLAVAQEDAQVIVVDYSCPDDCGDWVEDNYPSVKVVRVPGRQQYNRSESRNIGAAAGDSPWLLFMDADILPRHDFTAQLFELLEPDCSLHANTDAADDRTGTYACQRSTFESLGGYDETMTDWGAEDVDMFRNLRRQGVRKAKYDRNLLVPIIHSDEMRTRFHDEKDRKLSNVVNTLYSSVRRDMEALTGKDLGEQPRQQVYRYVRSTVEATYRNQRADDLRLMVSREYLHEKSLTRVLHYHIESNDRSWMPDEPSVPLQSFAENLPALRQRWPSLEMCNEEQPVFLFAAGHRSGSTLLQRMLMQNCWLWGEPYGESMLLDGLTRLFRTLRSDWPAEAFMDESHADETDPAKAWVANRYPPMQSTVDATLGYLKTLLRDPARRHGRPYWGIKEVRYDADMAHCLRWLFPNARFVFLVRNPYDCFRSYARFEKSWYLRWPDKQLLQAHQFGSHWRRLAESFFRDANSLGAFIVRYEDLLSPDYRLKDLEGYLGFGVDLDAQEHWLDGSPPLAEPKLAEDDFEDLKRAVEPFAAKLGYRRLSGKESEGAV